MKVIEEFSDSRSYQQSRRLPLAYERRQPAEKRVAPF